MNDHIQSICKCGHMESFHGGARMFKDGKMPPLNKNDCRGSDCPCSQFTFDKKICIYCKAEAGMTQYARALKSDGSAVNAEDILVCRNYPHCEKAEKDTVRRLCKCNEPLCAKCLSINCQDDNCPTHTKEAKEKFKKV